MATLTKSRARKPLAECKPSLSYGMRLGVNDSAHGPILSMFSDAEEGKSYTLHLSNAELDAIVKMRDNSRAEFDEQDRRHGIKNGRTEAPRNVRIAIEELTTVCRLFGECKIVAAGSLWFTVETNDLMRQSLSTNRISWAFD